MRYTLEIGEQVYRDLKHVPKKDGVRIIARIQKLTNGLQGDVKRLTNFEPQYRLRIGDYRVMFDVQGNRIIVHQVLHRKDAY